jgi:putative CocE/NonD family hydrolase
MTSRPVSETLFGVRIHRDARIPMRDGLELSANLWLPAAHGADGPEPGPVPAVLEMIPYRKDDWRANGDAARGAYLAARGYAFCRLDIRGTGSSPGVAVDEYTAAETSDGHDAVEWLAAQPWCNGNVGMWGISYGGFTAIQVAKLRPPHLRAIVPMYATDDRYLDDVHYVGGCVTASELTQYAVSMIANNALPARPAYRGATWLEEWRERLDRTPVWSVEWLRQQHDGPYWRRGSLAPEYGAIDVPMLLIGGWMDSYVDPVFRMLERCTAPRRAFVGNWVHEYPDDGYPRPNVDWLHELLRFFDRHLKGIANGEDSEPQLTWFEREWAPPEPFPKAWPGRWRAARSYPPPGMGVRRWHLDSGPGSLHGQLAARSGPAAGGSMRLPHRPTLGTRGSLSWGAGSAPNGLARDLRPDEARLPTFESEPLEADVHVLGRAVVSLALESDMPVATVVARLSDAAPDGTPIEVAAGVLNLTHRESHASPAALPVGERLVVRLQLRSAGYRFAAGHRIRLSIATGAWPILWPSPFPGSLVLHLGGDDAFLELPVVPASDEIEPTAFKTSPPQLPEFGGGSDDPAVWRITDDVIDGSVTVTTFEGGEAITGDGTRLYSSEGHAMTARDADPARAEMRSEIRYRLEQDGVVVDSDADAVTSSTAESFQMDVTLRVRLDGEPFFERTWSEAIPRDLV